MWNVACKYKHTLFVVVTVCHCGVQLEATEKHGSTKYQDLSIFLHKMELTENVIERNM